MKHYHNNNYILLVNLHLILVDKLEQLDLHNNN